MARNSYRMLRSFSTKNWSPRGMVMGEFGRFFDVWDEIDEKPVKGQFLVVFVAEKIWISVKLRLYRSRARGNQNLQ